MAEKVTVELPEDLARRARELAAQSRRPFEEVLVDWIGRTVTDPPLDFLSNEQLVILCDAQMNSSDQEKLSDLLGRNQEGLLEEAERKSLDELMQIYRIGLVRKAR